MSTTQLPKVLIAMIKEYATEPDIKVAIIGSVGSGKHALVHQLLSTNEETQRNDNIITARLLMDATKSSTNDNNSPLIQFVIISTTQLDAYLHSGIEKLCYKEQSELLISMEINYDIIIIVHDITNRIIDQNCMDMLLTTYTFQNAIRWLVVTKIDEKYGFEWMSTSFECAKLVYLNNINGNVFVTSFKTGQNINEIKQALLNHFHDKTDCHQSDLFDNFV